MDLGIFNKAWEVCEQCITISVITIASMLSGVAPSDALARTFIIGFLATVSFVIMGYAIAEFYKIGSWGTIAISFTLGRFSYVLEKQIEKLINLAPLIAERFKK